MEESGIIEHQGVIAKISEDKLFVNLTNVSNCSACHAKAMCNVSEVDNKTLEIDNKSKLNFSIGDPVILKVAKSSGPKALALGYLVPLILVTATLFIVSAITGNEALSGLISLLILAPYYLFIYLIRDQLKSKFTFGIKSLIKT